MAPRRSRGSARRPLLTRRLGYGTVGGLVGWLAAFTVFVVLVAYLSTFTPTD